MYNNVHVFHKLSAETNMFTGRATRLFLLYVRMYVYYYKIIIMLICCQVYIFVIPNKISFSHCNVHNAIHCTMTIVMTVTFSGTTCTYV